MRKTALLMFSSTCLLNTAGLSVYWLCSGDVEEYVYDDDCDCDCDCCDCDDDCVEVTCPACGEEVCIDFDAIDENGQVECPACGELLEFEIDECDCDCEDCE